MKEIPVYLITGFLESGKTSFITPMILKDNFTEGEKTILFVCEEGEEEYDQEALARQNVVVVPIENYEDMTTQFFKECEKKYRPQQVLFEYNGMWMMQPLAQEILPENWTLYQIVALVDATTYDVYAKNMATLMTEKLRNADLIIFNRAQEDTKALVEQRNLPMLNRRAEIYLEYGEDRVEKFDMGLPFDDGADFLDLSDDQYGAWYMDVMEHPDKYKGKTVRYQGMVAKSKKFPDKSFVVGRFAMVCCEEDKAFFGLLCLGDVAEQVKNRDWVRVQGRVDVQDLEITQGPCAVILAEQVEHCEMPEDTLITL